MGEDAAIETTTPARRRRRGRAWLVVLLAAVVVLWLGYWFGSRHFASAAVERAVASLDAQGRGVGCANRAGGGFPFSLDVSCDEARFDDRNTGTSVAVTRVAASAPLYNPGRVAATVEGPLVLTRAGGGLEATWHAAAIDVDAGLDGVNGVSVNLDQVGIAPGDGSGSTAAAARVVTTARPGEGDAYRFTIDAEDVTLRVGDRDVPAFSANAALTAEDFGRSLGTDPVRAVLSWLAAGGEVAVDRFGIVTGNASAQATGTLRLSPEGLVSGELAVRVTGLDQIPALAEQLQPGSRDRVDRLVRAAGALMRPAPDDPGARTVPVTIRDGVARIGLIPLGTIPPLRF